MLESLTQDIASYSGLGTLNVAPSPSQFFSYYPKYDYLDKLFNLNPKEHLNVFVDVKGCSPALFSEWGVKYIIEDSKQSKHLNMSYFAGVIEFIAWHKHYCQKRNLTLNMHFFMEQGKSIYHNSVYKEYKSNRILSDFFGLDLADQEYFKKVMDLNYNLLEYTINKIPNCSFYKLKYVEADFIPWYLLEYLIPGSEQKQSINLIYTRDKDMLQCLKFPNTYQYYRANWHETTSVITPKSLLRHWAKLKENVELDRVAEWFPLFLSMLGDNSDSIPGIKGVGYKVIIKFLNEIVSTYGGDPDKMYDTVMNGNDVLSESFKYTKSITSRKIFGNQDILKRNMKLISFRALSEWVNGGFPLQTVEVKKYIESIYNSKEKLKDFKVILNALNSKGLNDVLNETSLERCFTE